jgi:hypothetical protein
MVVDEYFAEASYCSVERELGGGSYVAIVAVR